MCRRRSRGHGRIVVVTPDCSAIVLAGGSSHRMGRDKATLIVEGRTLMQRVVDAVGAVADDILIVGRTEALDQERTIAVPDELSGRGPLGGVLTGLRRARHDYCLTVACDLPWLQATVLRHLIRLSAGHDAVVPVVGGRLQVLHAVYARRLIPTFESSLDQGERSLRRLVIHADTCWVDEDDVKRYDPSLRSFVNVNTPDDWQRMVDWRAQP